MSTIDPLEPNIAVDFPPWLAVAMLAVYVLVGVGVYLRYRLRRRP